MNLRKIIFSVLGIVILAGSVVVFKSFSGRSNRPPEVDTKNSSVVVRALVVKNEEITSTISITGRLNASEQTDIYAEVGGKANFSKPSFKSGNKFSKGQVMLYIDNDEFSASLASTKSQFMATLAQVLPDIKLDFNEEFEAWQAFLDAIDVYKSIPNLPVVKGSKLKLFLSGRGIYTSYYKIKEAETRLAKYNVRAPFTGYLTDAMIDQGSIVRLGQQLGEFIKSGSFELESSVNYRLLDQFKTGMKLNFKDVSTSKTYQGQLIRINNKIDPNTQLVKLYFELDDASLKPGIYLEAQAPATQFASAVKLPVSAIVDNAFVFAVENGLAKKHAVSILDQDSRFAIVEGLKDGSKVILDQKNSAFEGASVIIN